MGKKDWRDIGPENILKALEKIKQTENFWLDLSNVPMQKI